MNVISQLFWHKNKTFVTSQLPLSKSCSRSTTSMCRWEGPTPRTLNRNLPLGNQVRTWVCCISTLTLPVPVHMWLNNRLYVGSFLTPVKLQKCRTHFTLNPGRTLFLCWAENISCTWAWSPQVTSRDIVVELTETFNPCRAYPSESRWFSCRHTFCQVLISLITFTLLF